MRTVAQRESFLGQMESEFRTRIKDFIEKMRTGEDDLIHPVWDGALVLFQGDEMATDYDFGKRQYLVPNLESLEEITKSSRYRGAYGLNTGNVFSRTQRETLCRKVLSQLGVNAIPKPSFWLRLKGWNPFSGIAWRVSPTNLPDFSLLCGFSGFNDRGTFALWYNPYGISQPFKSD